MPQVTIYTDGSCLVNPGGPGGWACILMCNGARRELSGGVPETTNNRMELQAAIEGLKALKYFCEVEIWTDSQYLKNAFTEGWLTKWLRNGWKAGSKSKKHDVKNRDLWEELYMLTTKHQVRWCWVRGHQENPFNNRCDELAGQAARAMKNPTEDPNAVSLPPEAAVLAGAAQTGAGEEILPL
jgi:ribonuclease HI